VLVVLGIWGGLIPFIGPYFNYSFGPNVTWHYTVHRLWLDILPGAATVLGGLLIINARSRIDGTFGSWLALAGGAWFAVGPPVSRLWNAAATAMGPIGAPYGGIHRQILEQVGYYYGVGVLIVGFAAFSLGRFVSRPGLADERQEAESLAEVRATEQRTAARPAPVAERPAAERPAAERPMAERPMAEQPETEESEVEQPVAEEPEGEQPTAVRDPEPVRGPQE